MTTTTVDLEQRDECPNCETAAHTAFVRRPGTTHIKCTVCDWDGNLYYDPN